MREPVEYSDGDFYMTKEHEEYLKLNKGAESNDGYFERK